MEKKINAEKLVATSAILLLLTAALSAIVIRPVSASPKSLYLVANHHTAQFDAWNIGPDGTATYQATYMLAHATDPAGIAIDESSNTLFVSSEFSGGVEMVDATTMTPLGVSPGPSNLAGVDTDDAKNIVYAVERYTNNLYVYGWDPITHALTPQLGSPISLPGCLGGFGIAFDNTTNILWVADAAAGVARAYDASTWAEDMSKSFTPVHKPVDIAVDRLTGSVYTVSMSYGAWTPPGTGSTLLSKYDLATGTETTGNLADQGVGVAVDEVTGLVYVTVSPYGRGLWQGDLEVWDSSSWIRMQSTPVSGGPAGICIPRTEVSFNPLSLEKDDGLAGQCVKPGATITYTISFNNTNPYTVTAVSLWDDMSDYTTFVSATGGGGGYTWSYDPVSHSVAWNIGDLPTASPDSVTLRAKVNLDTPTIPGTRIINKATIKPINMIGGETTVVEETDVCVPPPVIDVDVDVKPGSWPNPINIVSKGVFAAAICGTEDFDVSTIDPSTVKICIEGTAEGISPIRWSYQDAATPFTGPEGEGHALCGDGYLDLLFHFDTQAVVTALGLAGHVGQTIPLMIKGNLLESAGGTPIQGQDYVRIINSRLAPKGDLTGSVWGVPDGRIDTRDLGFVLKFMGTKYPDYRYYSECDLNNDLRIDSKDISTVARNFGQKAY